jgi:hypothetical protein
MQGQNNNINYWKLERRYKFPSLYVVVVQDRFQKQKHDPSKHEAVVIKPFSCTKTTSKIVEMFFTDLNGVFYIRLHLTFLLTSY